MTDASSDHEKEPLMEISWEYAWDCAKVDVKDFSTVDAMEIF